MEQTGIFCMLQVTRRVWCHAMHLLSIGQWLPAYAAHLTMMATLQQAPPKYKNLASAKSSFQSASSQPHNMYNCAEGKSDAFHCES